MATQHATLKRKDSPSVQKTGGKRTKTTLSPAAAALQSDKIRIVSDSFDPETEATAAAAYLDANGLVVLRSAYLSANVQKIRDRFERDLSEMPEFLHRSGSDPQSSYVRGGFSALGNASSWHMPTTRWLRSHAMRAVFPVFAELLREQPGAQLAQLADRVMWRPSGVKPPGDAWHRDIFPSSAPNETIYGGWISLDTATDQFLSCRMGTHREDHGAACGGGGGVEGFAPISNECLLQELRLHHDHIRIPPGAILLFNERTYHEVLSRALPHASARLFLAWLTTPVAGKCNPPNLDSLLAEQAVIPLKSGQVPRMWPALDGVYRGRQLADWTAVTLQPCMKQAVLRGDKLLFLPYKVAPSLREARLPLYEAYAPQEIALLHASRQHALPRSVGAEETSLFSL
jgi:ectoine hydroxylase-related dioxygenase (phytanoyl-CoA dioxygenase family)